MKPYYYTFEWKDRVITLCLDIEVSLEQLLDNRFKVSYRYNTNLYMGYSVKLPQDVLNEELAKSIALGRSKKHSTRLLIISNSVVQLETKFNILADKGLLKSIARNCERNIKDSVIVIKGIK